MDCGEYLLKKTNSLQRTERREIATDCNFTTAIGSLHSLIIVTVFMLFVKQLVMKLSPVLRKALL